MTTLLRVGALLILLGAARSLTAAPPLAALAGTDLPEDATLALPAIGSSELRVISPTVLELTLVNTEAPGRSPATWGFVTGGTLALPATSKFQVLVNGSPAAISAVGFKRRVRYAPNARRDLRIGNYLYLVLAQAAPPGATVAVNNPDGSLWPSTMKFASTAAPRRRSPALHVNQEGYLPGHAKRAMVGYYLGSLGELTVPAAAGFSLIDDAGNTVYTGALVKRPDQGSNLTPAPYQQVYQADFTAFDTPGRYRLAVTGLGTSFPFRIDASLAGDFARAYALGLYHQRCGSDNALPFTRFQHGPCHTAPAQVPDTSAVFAATNAFISQFSSGGPPQIAPALKDVAASLYPFHRTGTVDVHGGHHDAGDYSKYLINSAQLVHHLCFAADNFPGVAALDNLGLPESGNGKSDVLELAKWEADYLVRMQDSDGGFCFLTYPRDDKYEWNVTPDHGFPQVIWPKNTSVTACATAALAQMATSPTFKRQFPAEAARYLAAARSGWAFLQSAWARYGRAGAFQYVTFYGSDFGDLDEIVWCETEMYLATQDPAIHARLLRDFDPSDPATIKWNWWRLFEGYGCAVRDYAFAASSGRVPVARLDAAFLTRCQQQIDLAAHDAMTWTDGSAYGVSYSYNDKRSANASWFETMYRSFDLAVANARRANPRYVEGIVSNLNYELGTNPSNVCFLTGVGWLRQREIVSQYAANARQHLPPSGLPIGSLSSTEPYLSTYSSELRDLSYPPDTGTPTSYGMYDRWSDSWNVQTEIVTCLAARGLAALLPLMAASPVQSQNYDSIPARIVGVPASVSAGAALTPTLETTGTDLSGARVVWDAAGAEPVFANARCSLTPQTPGASWIEAEAQWPDGRRAFAAFDFSVRSEVSEASAPPPAPTATSTQAPDAITVSAPFGMSGSVTGFASNVLTISTYAMAAQVPYAQATITASGDPLAPSAITVGQTVGVTVKPFHGTVVSVKGTIVTLSAPTGTLILPASALPQSAQAQIKVSVKTAEGDTRTMTLDKAVRLEGATVLDNV